MSTLHLPEKGRLTHLQRAFRVFERMGEQLLSCRGLAAVMNIEVKTAYNYIFRLKEANCIQVKGGSGKVPMYGLAPGASMPAGDGRGRKPKERAAASHGDSDDLAMGTGQ